MHNRLHSFKILCVSMGGIKLSQLCVPAGTNPANCSATTMPPNQDRHVLLNVVIKIDPPGYKMKQINYYSIQKNDCVPSMHPNNWSKMLIYQRHVRAPRTQQLHRIVRGAAAHVAQRLHNGNKCVRPICDRPTVDVLRPH